MQTSLDRNVYYTLVTINNNNIHNGTILYRVVFFCFLRFLNFIVDIANNNNITKLNNNNGYKIQNNCGIINVTREFLRNE